jgi:hypothetical protein
VYRYTLEKDREKEAFLKIEEDGGALLSKIKVIKYEEEKKVEAE